MALLLPGDESGCDEPGRRFERHHHLHAYAALVVRGSCDEVGDRGRFHARVGDVLIHRAFDGHGDHIGKRGASFINFLLPSPPAASCGTVLDVDSIVRAYECDPFEAAHRFGEQLRISEPSSRDWPDLLASELSTGSFEISTWADSRGLHPASVSRGFRLAYGMSPKRFRLEQRASIAARALRSSGVSATAIAADSGFADQAHMARAISALFGFSPGQLRTFS